MCIPSSVTATDASPLDTTSLWEDGVQFPTFAPLSEDLTVDVAIVGAGVFGLTTAYLLVRLGLTVAVLERDRCGGVDSLHTTAHLTCVTDARLHELADAFGEEGARAAWEGGMAAIDRIAGIVRSAAIDCGFRWVTGYLHAGTAPDASDRQLLQRDAELAARLGFECRFLNAVPHFGTPGVEFPNQARFHPGRYLRALTLAIAAAGGRIHERSEAAQIHGDPPVVSCNGHSVKAGWVIMATHSPLAGINDAVSAAVLTSKLYCYNSYAVAARVRPGSLPEALFWDTCSPYHYLRVDRHEGFDLAVLGGEDHKTGQETDTPSRYGSLEAKLAAWIPGAEVTRRWSGQVVETHDGLPLIGESAPRQFVATGFAGNGMTFGTLAAMMAADACLGRANPWSELFAPDRRKVRGGTWRYLTENKDYPYFLVRDHLGGAPNGDPRELKRGEGRVLTIGGRKVAAYRDERGQLSYCSPVCTHLKCVVAWNGAEQTWDCPCHGSRFRPTGEVLSGPAERPLAPVGVPPELRT